MSTDREDYELRLLALREKYIHTVRRLLLVDSFASFATCIIAIFSLVSHDKWYACIFASEAVGFAYSAYNRYQALLRETSSAARPTPGKLDSKL